MIAPPFLEIVPLKPRRLWEEQNLSQAFRWVGLKYSGSKASFRKPDLSSTSGSIGNFAKIFAHARRALRLVNANDFCSFISNTWVRNAHIIALHFMA
jgi:hypothetical protein